MLPIALDGPSTLPEDAAIALNGPSNAPREALPMILNGPSVFLGDTADGFEWAQTMVLKGAADCLEWAQQFS